MSDARALIVTCYIILTTVTNVSPQADSTAASWVRHYSSGDSSSYDRATALAVDGAGNVYVTGAAGFLWCEHGRCDFNSDSTITIKYNADGEILWVTANNPVKTATSQVVDTAGNVYVTGISFGNDTFEDYGTVKYNSAGTQQWVARYDGPGNNSDYAQALAVDGLGNVYVTGSDYSSSTYFDYATVKYNSAGVQQWVARYSGPANGNDGAASLAVDGLGNVYVTGHSYGSSTSTDYATVKYNSAGAQQWAVRYDGGGYDWGRVLAVDDSGNVYVTGYSDSSKTAYYDDYATVKYNSAGVEQWVARYFGPGSADNRVQALALDGLGNVYVTGYSHSTSTWGDYATVKYSPDGTELWAARYNGSESSWDVAQALAVDGLGYVYVTGESGGELATLKYNADGVLKGLAIYGEAGITMTAVGLGLDDIGNGGSSEGANQSWSTFTTLKYSEIPEVLAIDKEEVSLPPHFTLQQNSPNPFNPTTTIRFTMPEWSEVSLIVYDILGRQIQSLVQSPLPTGSHSIIWRGRDERYRPVPSGIYIARLVTPAYTKSIKMVLLK